MASLAIALLFARALRSSPTHHRDAFPRDEELEEPEETAELELQGTEVADQPTIAARRQIAEIAAREAVRERGRTSAAAEVPTWTNLGPLDSIGPTPTQPLTALPLGGRIYALRVDPRDSSRILAASDGGIWTARLTSSGATWQPLSDSMPVLAIGSLDLDPLSSDTIYAGLGDPLLVPFGGIAKSSDGGRTWSAPVLLTGSSSATLGAPRAAGHVVDVRVDPADGRNVYVGTDLGLFASSDAGQTFTLIDLPNGSEALIERIWSIAYLGALGGHSIWMVTGTTGCAPGRMPPHPANGTVPSTSCPAGNLGDVWYFDGTNAVSLRVANELPFQTDTQGNRIEISRVELAAAPAADASQAVVYGMVANINGRGTVDVWRSAPSPGASPLGFASIYGPVDNPASPCTSLNVGAVQAWFDQAIAVDGADPNHVALAGITCGVETHDAMAATPTWSVFTTPLSTVYIHADWHALVLDSVTGSPRAIGGNDGGLFWADLSTRDSYNEPPWQNANRGLTAQQCYTIASGDPATADTDLLISGLQDNGTQLWVPATAGQFAHVGGGDGTGVAIAHDATGAAILWESVTTGSRPPPREYCRPADNDCHQPSSWQQSNPTLPTGDSEPFSIYFSAIDGDPDGAALTNSQARVWKVTRALAWSDVTGTSDFTAQQGVVRPFAGSSSLFGVVLGSGHTAVTGDGGQTWTLSAGQLGIGAARDQSLAHASYLAFPPTVASGAQPGDVYVAASADLLLADGTPIPSAIGHLFITSDRGAHFAPLVGDGTGNDLPNVPVYALRYDPADANVLYVATEIGLYATTDGGHTFARVGQGLPMVRTTDIALASDHSFVRVSTFGRGLWALAMSDKGDMPQPPSASKGGGCCNAAQDGGGNALTGLLVLGWLVRSRRSRATRRYGAASWNATM